VDSSHVVDAAVHPLPARGEQLRGFLSEPWRSLPLPGPHRYLSPAPSGVAPFGEFRREARSEQGLPGSDPELVRRHLDELGGHTAILLPLCRGLLANVDLGTAVCAAANDWLAATWLGDGNQDGRFRGTIRVNPEDPAAAVREIERWAGDERFVQLGVPLEAHRPYGQRNYTPIWEAAVRHGLPVAVHSEPGSGTDFFPTPNGYHRHYVEYHALLPANFIYHLSSLVAEGILDRLPGLRFVFADGGFDLLMPLVWRMDLDWPISRIETPWISRRPTEYLKDHFRFTTARLEGPPDAILPDWFETADGADLLMYASNYPHWTTMSAAECFPQLPEEARARVLGGNARELYRLPQPAPA
jgi:uncharacterized protein